MTVWGWEKAANRWTKTVIVPLLKKGDKLECKKSRGISLLNNPIQKILKKLLNLIKDKAEEMGGGHQEGFIKCISNIYFERAGLKILGI